MPGTIVASSGKSRSKSRSSAPNLAALLPATHAGRGKSAADSGSSKRFGKSASSKSGGSSGSGCDISGSTGASAATGVPANGTSLSASTVDAPGSSGTPGNDKSS